MPFAKIEEWTECPECESGLEFSGYRTDPLVCTGFNCDWTEQEGHQQFTDLMECPDCGSWRVDAKYDGYRENHVYCKACDLEERDWYDRD